MHPGRLMIFTRFHNTYNKDGPICGPVARELCVKKSVSVEFHPSYGSLVEFRVKGLQYHSFRVSFFSLKALHKTHDMSETS